MIKEIKIISVWEPKPLNLVKILEKCYKKPRARPFSRNSEPEPVKEINKTAPRSGNRAFFNGAGAEIRLKKVPAP